MNIFITLVQYLAGNHRMPNLDHGVLKYHLTVLFVLVVACQGIAGPPNSSVIPPLPETKRWQEDNTCEISEIAFIGESFSQGFFIPKKGLFVAWSGDNLAVISLRKLKIESRKGIKGLQDVTYSSFRDKLAILYANGKKIRETNLSLKSKGKSIALNSAYDRLWPFSNTRYLLASGSKSVILNVTKKSFSPTPIPDQERILAFAVLIPLKSIIMVSSKSSKCYLRRFAYQEKAWVDVDTREFRGDKVQDFRLVGKEYLWMRGRLYYVNNFTEPYHRGSNRSIAVSPDGHVGIKWPHRSKRKKKKLIYDVVDLASSDGRILCSTPALPIPSKPSGGKHDFARFSSNGSGFWMYNRAGYIVKYVFSDAKQDATSFTNHDFAKFPTLEIKLQKSEALK